MGTFICGLLALLHLLRALVLSTPVPVTCERLFVPPASVAHELVFLDHFDDVHEQARELCAAKRIPRYRCEGVIRQFLDGLQDMADHGAGEALVNVTLDHTLGYEISYAPTTADAPTRLENVVVIPEVPLNETIAGYCAAHGMTAAACIEMQEGIRQLVLRDWGCQDATAVADGPSPVQVQGPAPTESSQAEPAGKIAGLELVEMPITVNGQAQVVTVSIHDDLDIFSAGICRKWTLSVGDCARLREFIGTRVAEARGRLGAAPIVDDEISCVPHGPSDWLVISSPLADAEYPTSQRIYIDLAWRAEHQANTSQPVCVHADNAPEPVYCGVIPVIDDLYFVPFRIGPGPHMITVTLPPDAEAAIPGGSGGEILGARFFTAAEPSIELVRVEIATVDSGSFFDLRIRLHHLRRLDPRLQRICALFGDDLECFKGEQLEFLPSNRSNNDGNSGKGTQSLDVRAPMFNIREGAIEATVLLVNEYNKVLTMSRPIRLHVQMTTRAVRTLPRNASLFHDPPMFRHHPRPRTCPPRLAASPLGWLCDLWRREWGLYSQNGEDGVLRAIFHHLGVRHRYYVEFGTESGDERNTRLLRDVDGWDGLLMDGSHENRTINLRRAWVTAENVNELFARYTVPEDFDLLSVDVDFNDYWILRALDRRRFSPRVIVIEVNAHVPPDEPRAVTYDPAGQWDGRTDYFGVSVAGIDRWARASGYSLVYCESRGVNCFLIRDDELLAASGGLRVSEVLGPTALHAPPNFFGRGLRYYHEPPSPTATWEWIT